jgi:hypothetical protein
LHDILSRSFSRRVTFWYRTKLITRILHMSIITNRRRSAEQLQGRV